MCACVRPNGIALQVRLSVSSFAVATVILIHDNGQTPQIFSGSTIKELPN